MTKLAAELQRATFRGVEFEFVDVSEEGGRRVAIHEFPGSDKTAVDDLGASQRMVTLAAFTSGVGFVAAAERFLAVLEEPGEGDLIHPTRGALRVRPTRWTSFLSAEPVGKVEIRVTFALIDPPPPQTLNAPALSLGETDALDASLRLRQEFAAAFRVEGLDLGALERARLAVAGVLEAYDTAALKLSETVGKAQEAAFLVRAVRARVEGLLALPSELARQLGDVADVLRRALAGRPTRLAEEEGDLGRGRAGDTPARALVRDVSEARETEARLALWREILRTGMPRDQDTGPGARNLAALSRLFLGDVLSGVSDVLRGGTFLTDQQATSARTEALAIVDSLLEDSLLGGAEDDALYASLSSLRAELVTLTLRVARSLRTLDVPRDMPSLVLSYDLYGSCDAADVLACGHPDPLSLPRRLEVLQ